MVLISHRQNFYNIGEKMPRSLDIFIRTSEPIEEIVSKVGSVCNVNFERNTDGDEITYISKTSGLTLMLYEHMLEDDRAMFFSNYKYQISIIPDNIGTSEQRELSLMEWGEMLYNKLRELGHFGLMMVDDVQIKLREDSP
jgi:hypothetical protein